MYNSTYKSELIASRPIALAKLSVKKCRTSVTSTKLHTLPVFRLRKIWVLGEARCVCENM